MEFRRYSVSGHLVHHEQHYLLQQWSESFGNYGQSREGQLCTQKAKPTPENNTPYRILAHRPRHRALSHPSDLWNCVQKEPFPVGWAKTTRAPISFVSCLGATGNAKRSGERREGRAVRTSQQVPGEPVHGRRPAWRPTLRTVWFRPCLQHLNLR